METGVSCASFQSLNRALSADKQVPVKGWWMRAALPATRIAERVSTRAAFRVVGRGGQDGMVTHPDPAGLESAALRRSGKAKGRKPRASRTTSANSTGFPLEPQAFAGRVQPRIDLTLRATNHTRSGHPGLAPVDSILWSLATGPYLLNQICRLRGEWQRGVGRQFTLQISAFAYRTPGLWAP